MIVRSWLRMTLRVPPVPLPRPGSILPLKDAPCRTPFVARSQPADMVWLGHDLGYCFRTVDHARWVVTLPAPEEQDFYGMTLEEALAWCLV